MGRPDDDLLSRVTSGNRQALWELLEECTPTLRRPLAGRIPRRWQSLLSVDDVLQQTYADALLNVDRFVPQQDGSFSAWLSTIADRNRQRFGEGRIPWAWRGAAHRQ